MANSSVGIDISADQAVVPAGPWLFVVHKATEGGGYTDPLFERRYEGLRSMAPIVGAYHYANVVGGDPVAQARRFAAVAVNAGFKPGVDIWQLDCEQADNDGCTSQEWRTFIPQFMAETTKLLGARGFLYMGWPFAVQYLLTNFIEQYNWWLPDYSINDGFPHIVQTPPWVTPSVVLHQFTSQLEPQGLDGNDVLGTAAWDKMFTPPINWSVLKQIAAFVKAVTSKPLRAGDTSPGVAKLNWLLGLNGYHVGGSTYNKLTVTAVADFKRRRGLKNRAGNVCGRACLLALYKYV